MVMLIAFYLEFGVTNNSQTNQLNPHINYSIWSYLFKSDFQLIILIDVTLHFGTLYTVNHSNKLTNKSAFNIKPLHKTRINDKYTKLSYWYLQNTRGGYSKRNFLNQRTEVLNAAINITCFYSVISHNSLN